MAPFEIERTLPTRMSAGAVIEDESSLLLLRIEAIDKALVLWRTAGHPSYVLDVETKVASGWHYQRIGIYRDAEGALVGIRDHSIRGR